MLQLHYKSKKGNSTDHYSTDTLDARSRLEKRLIALYHQRTDAILLDERHEKVGEVIADGSVEGTWWYDASVFPATPTEKSL